MALAKVSRVVGVTPVPILASIDALMEVAYSGVEVPLGAEVRYVHILIGELDLPSTIRTLVSAAVIDEASLLGFVVSGTEILMPAWQKGV